MCAGGIRLGLPQKKHALLGKEETLAGPTCTPQGHPFISFTLITNSLNSVARIDHVQWTPTSLPDSIVLLGGRDDAAKHTAEIVPGFRSGQVFKFSLLQVEEPLI